jgi:hypothetical protein
MREFETGITTTLAAIKQRAEAGTTGRTGA